MVDTWKHIKRFRQDIEMASITNKLISMHTKTHPNDEIKKEKTWSCIKL